MLDELRQMEQLSRSQRRKFKVIQIARERWMQGHDTPPNLSELSAVCGIEVNEIAELEQAASTAQTQSLNDDDDDGEHYTPQGSHAATANDEVEARVDTAILLRRLEKFFATLPERERQVIDAYMGIGMSTEEVAESLGVSTSRVSQIYQATVKRITLHFQHKDQRALDRVYPARSGPEFENLVASREAQMRWGTLLEDALTAPDNRFGARGRRKTASAAATGGGEGGETA